MDYLQFTASLVGSLAWPGVVAFLLFLLRKQLVGLIARIIKAKLPGGIEVAFSEGLAETSAIVEDLATKKGIEGIQRAEVPRTYRHELRMRQKDWFSWWGPTSIDPESVVLRAFKEIEGLIDYYASRMPHRRGITTRINWLAHKGIIDEETKQLFFELRNLKLIAAAGGGDITVQQAIAYVEQCQFLLKVLRVTLEKRFPSPKDGEDAG